MNAIAKVLYGSHLYGTSTPESDLDYRYVYLPTLNDCLLNRVRHSFAATNEEDGHYFSLQEFLRLASEGQPIAIEMLYAPLGVETHATWSYLCANAHRFHTKSMLQMVGFAVTMSQKYGTRIERLKNVEAALSVIDDGEADLHDTRLIDIWHLLPESIHTVKTINDSCSGAEKRVYQVCGREMQGLARLVHVRASLQSIIESYGERVRDAKDGKTDWRSIHHAFRAGFQLREILDTGSLRFPLAESDWLREVKLGNVDFEDEGLDTQLEELIAEVSEKMAKSDLPEKVDQKWLDSIVLDAYAADAQHRALSS